MFYGLTYGMSWKEDCILLLDGVLFRCLSNSQCFSSLLFPWWPFTLPLLKMGHESIQLLSYCLSPFGYILLHLFCSFFGSLYIYDSCIFLEMDFPFIHYKIPLLFLVKRKKKISVKAYFDWFLAYFPVSSMSSKSSDCYEIRKNFTVLFFFCCSQKQ